jgi:hypothetical protein
LELIEYIGLVKDLGISGIALFILYTAIRQRGKADEQENAKDTAYISLIQSLAANIQTSTATLQAVQVGVETAHTKMGNITERREAQLSQLQASIDKLPASVKAALINDFESVGNLLATLNQGVIALNGDVQRAFSEYAKMGAKLQALVAPEEQSSSTLEQAALLPTADKPTEEK